ncbi:Calponin-3, partial [Caligus rogercresseyi]
RAHAALAWLEAVLDKKVEIPNDELKDQYDFGTILKNGILLCELINKLNPGSVKKINTLNTPFKHDNIKYLGQHHKIYSPTAIGSLC